MAQPYKPGSWEEHLALVAAGEVQRVNPPLAPVYQRTPESDAYAAISGQLRTRFCILRLDGPLPTWEFRRAPLRDLGRRLRGIGGVLVEVLLGTGPLSALLDERLGTRARELRSILAAGREGASTEELAVRLATAYGQDDLLELWGRVQQIQADYEAAAEDGVVTDQEWADLLRRWGLA